MTVIDHRQRLYGIFDQLRERLGEHRLCECHGWMAWPTQGVYFFFEDGELRSGGAGTRIVRIGTHAVSRGSKTTLWKRLSQHKGTAKTGGGNHRGSIFRLHVGSSLIRREPERWGDLNSWIAGSNAPRHVKEAEHETEQAVTRHIGAMPFLWVRAEDEPSKHSVRSVIERNCIALLSRSAPDSGGSADPPSGEWLGHHCNNAGVRLSGLWNVRNVNDRYDHVFLDILERCADQTTPL